MLSRTELPSWESGPGDAGVRTGMFRSPQLTAMGTSRAPSGKMRWLAGAARLDAHMRMDGAGDGEEEGRRGRVHWGGPRGGEPRWSGRHTAVA